MILDGFVKIENITVYGHATRTRTRCFLWNLVEKGNAKEMNWSPLILQIASRAEVTIVVSCLHICPFQTLRNFKRSCNFNLLDLASELPLKGS